MDLLFLITITGLVTIAIVVVVFQARRRRRLERSVRVDEKIDLFHHGETNDPD